MRALNLSHQSSAPLWNDTPLIDADFKSKPMYTVDEFMDELCHRVGALYGLNDIREA